MQAVKGSACVSRVGEGVPRSRTSVQRLFRGTPKVRAGLASACETRALPGILNHMHVISGEHRLLARKSRQLAETVVFNRGDNTPIVAGRLPATAGW